MAWWKARWAEYTAAVVRHKVPYALNLGNHDALAGASMRAGGGGSWAQHPSSRHPAACTHTHTEEDGRGDGFRERLRALPSACCRRTAPTPNTSTSPPLHLFPFPPDPPSSPSPHARTPAVLDDGGREQLAHDIDAHAPLSRTQLGPSNVSRVSNYYLSLHPPAAPSRPPRRGGHTEGGQDARREGRGAEVGKDEESVGVAEGGEEAVDGRLEAALAGVWLLDSGKESCVGSPGWGCVLPDQVHARERARTCASEREREREEKEREREREREKRERERARESE